MRNVFIRLFPGSLSVPDAYGITVVRTLIVMCVEYYQCSDDTVLRVCTYLQLNGRIIPGLALPTMTVFQ